MRPTCQSCIKISPSAACTAPATQPPAFDLLSAKDSRCPRIALTLHRNLSGFADDERGRRSLRIIGGIEDARDIARLPRPRARQRSHDNSVRQAEIANTCWAKEGIGDRLGRLLPCRCGRVDRVRSTHARFSSWTSALFRRRCAGYAEATSHASPQSKRLRRGQEPREGRPNC
jgi:hypothetical protein